MENYNGSEHRTTETYLIQSTNSNPHMIAPPPLEEIDIMDNEAMPEFIVDQGLYYPAATNYYGYYCTGFEPPGEWSDHQSFFGLDGSDPHYTGLQTESLPYVYYTPSYGYAQSPYNPYNPYIPGAIIGVDGQFVGTQQYYTSPSYQQPVSSPTYFPIIVQSRPDIIPNNSSDPTLLNTSVSSSIRPDGTGLKHIPPRAPTGDGRAEQASVASLIDSSAKVPEGTHFNAASSKQPALQGTITSSSVLHSTSSHVTQGRNATGSVQPAENFGLGRVSSLRDPLKGMPANNGLVDFVSDTHGWSPVDKLRPRLQYGISNNGNGSTDVLGEQNRGPRTNRSKGQWSSPISVKAYTTKAGASNAQGNIFIYEDQYNRDDFPVNHADAKFFVIKSYSEDDVHKSIKYNVWSSTPNGNKRLDSAYEEAQRISGGNQRNCPVFLFFSVNASGQFCGVAEMVGPVDFHKDMDFWQQDKWNGSFPVKWHIVKDVPNTNFRHIILENNENKPVTNSRDTQEIKSKQGMEMLNIFKNYAMKTSILDDFLYYEERQKIMQEEKSRLFKSYDTPYFLPSFVPLNKPNGTLDQLPKADENPTKRHNDEDNLRKTVVNDEQLTSKIDNTSSSNSAEVSKHGPVEDKTDLASIMKMDSLSLNSKAGISNSSATVTGDGVPVDVVTVGSMPIKVNGFSESSAGILTVGTIPLDPKALMLDKQGNFSAIGR